MYSFINNFMIDGTKNDSLNEEITLNRIHIISIKQQFFKNLGNSSRLFPLNINLINFDEKIILQIVNTSKMIIFISCPNKRYMVDKIMPL